MKPRHITRAKEASALRMLRNAAFQTAPSLTDDECIEFAVKALGEDQRALIGRVWARHFKAVGAG